MKPGGHPVQTSGRRCRTAAEREARCHNAPPDKLPGLAPPNVANVGAATRCDLVTQPTQLGFRGRVKQFAHAINVVLACFR